MKNLSLLALSFLLVASTAQAKKYDIDPSHSAVSFKIRHMVSKVNGKFEKFSGSIDYDPAMNSAWKVNAKIQADSISTSNADRDKHLRSADFFDVKKFPEITFESKEIKKASGNTAEVVGTLKMHGVEKPVTIKLEATGVAVDPWGKERAGFTGTTTLNRKDFGIVYNKTLDKGALLLGDDVEVTLEIEGTAAAPKK